MRRITEENVAKYELLLSLITTGTKELKNKSLNKKYKTPFSPLTIKDACIELWITEHQYYSALRNNPDMAKRHHEYREVKRELIRTLAESNIEKAVRWELDISDWDLSKLSLSVLEKTDKAYNPKQEVKIETAYDNLTEEEIISRIKELINE